MPGHEPLRTSTDELVERMSNLPTYLQKGDCIQDKALFSIGVLDRRHLQKWEQCIQIDTDGKINSVEAPADVANGQVPSFPRRKEEQTVGADRTKKKNNAGSSVHVFAESGARGKLISACSCIVSADKSYLDTGKSRSGGAFRGLREPLLKPVATANNSQHSAKKLQRDSSSPDKGHKSSQREKASSDLYPLKRKLDFWSCRPINVDEPPKSEKEGSSSNVQALLQVTVKKGFPLLTFTVDRNSEILAATMRKSSTPKKKADKQFVYTFCRVPAVKKRWMARGCKFTDLACVSNVVAQMTVSDSKTCEVIAPHNGVSNVDMVREFVLSPVGLRKEESEQIGGNEELAAILLRIPKEFSTSSGIDTTVIVPGSVHAVPKKGEPSPLIQRWRTGGACDCGGWDLGCKLKVLTDRKQGDNKLAMGCSGMDTFELSYNYQGQQKDRRVFSLVPVTGDGGVFSAEFDDSCLSRLQAFAICIAALDCRKLSSIPFRTRHLSLLQLKDSGLSRC